MVPNVAGKDLLTATEEIQNAGYSVGIISRQISTTVAAGLVISTDPPAGSELPAGEKVHIVVSSGETVPYPDPGTPIKPPENVLSPKRDSSWYIQWIKTEFAPLTLATPDETLRQIIENAIRYWNTHSAYRITSMVDYAGGVKRIRLHPQFNSVVEVLPCKKTTWVWSDHPLWTLLGVTIIDNITGDLILLSEAYRNYRIYLGADMRWQFERSENPEEGGYLYVINVPSGVDKLAVIGTKRIVKDEIIQQEYILDWLLRYIKALTKQAEGNILRKSNIINVKNDGDQLYAEGKEEMEKLQEQLAIDGRWTSFACRG